MRYARFSINRKIDGTMVGIRTARLTWAVKMHICSLCGFHIHTGFQYWRSATLKICRRHVPESTFIA